MAGYTACMEGLPRLREAIFIQGRLVLTDTLYPS